MRHHATGLVGDLHLAKRDLAPGLDQAALGHQVALVAGAQVIGVQVERDGPHVRRELRVQSPIAEVVHHGRVHAAMDPAERVKVAALDINLAACVTATKRRGFDFQLRQKRALIDQLDKLAYVFRVHLMTIHVQIP